MRRYYQFDLEAWLSGLDNTSPAAVIAMLTNLPRSSAWSAHYYASHSGSDDTDLEVELSPEDEFELSVLEREEWSDTDLHIAAVVNKLSLLVNVLTNSKKNEFEVYGPDFLLSKEEARKRRKRQLAERRKASGPVLPPGSSDIDRVAAMFGFAPGVSGLSGG